MKKLKVLYQGWGEEWLLGVLADTGKAILFEYSAEAIARGLQLSPILHPLPRAGAAVVAFRGHPAFHDLPGFIADSLPDGWGLLLMDRALRRAGRNPQQVSVLERLAIVGNRAMGALRFEPAEEDALPDAVLSLRMLADEVAQVQNDESAVSSERLLQLMRLGGSPQGARPKVLVNVDAAPWLIKFPATDEHAEVSAIEELYARVARAGGIDMSPSRFFDLGDGRSAFGAQRFDRKEQQRVPILSLSGLLQADFRLPSLDYASLLLATARITGNQHEVQKAFSRCVFNVLMHNRDDHARNFAFCMNAQGRWTLSPAFDLTYSYGAGGEHATSIAGHGKNITRAHLLQVAKQGGVDKKFAEATINHWLKQVQDFLLHAENLPIRKTTVQELMQITHQTCQICEVMV